MAAECPKDMNQDIGAILSAPAPKENKRVNDKFALKDAIVKKVAEAPKSDAVDIRVPDESPKKDDDKK